MATIKPTVDSVGDAALADSIIDKSITALQDNVVTKLRDSALSGCTALKKVAFGVATGSQGTSIFSNCTALETIDFHQNVDLGSYSLNGCTALKALILRSTTLCETDALSPLEGSSIANGTGYLYVPRALVDAYKAHRAWGQYASQIRAIEDYPAICGDAGKEWMNATYASTNATFEHAIHADGLWVLSGDSGTYWSEDGKTFTRSFTSGGSLCYADGLWVSRRKSYGLYYSEDAKTWNQSNVTSGNIYSVSNANGLWVAGGNNGLYYSDDGKTWTQSNVTSGEYYCCGYYEGLWLAGGYNLGVYTSSDGKTWTSVSGTGSTVRALCYANGTWVASGKATYYSTDGVNWTSASGMSTSYTTYKIRHEAGLWVAARHSGNTTGAICWSEDGKTWQEADAPASGYKCVDYADGLWVAAGYGLRYSLDGKTWSDSNITSGVISTLAHSGGLWVAGGQRVIYYSE